MLQGAGGKREWGGVGVSRGLAVYYGLEPRVVWVGSGLLYNGHR